MAVYPGGQFQVLDTIEEFLANNHQTGKTTMVFIDEARISPLGLPGAAVAVIGPSSCDAPVESGSVPGSPTGAEDYTSNTYFRSPILDEQHMSGLAGSIISRVAETLQRPC
jgi:hypothetical protein